MQDKTTKAPGKSYRKGITLIDAVKMFDTEEKAEDWFMAQRWEDGVRCSHCESFNVSARPNRKPQPFHCQDCRKYFSVKTGTVLQSSKIPLSKWAIAFYLYSTNLKGVSSMKLHRDLGITQKSAWHMAHRIRESWDVVTEKFAGPVEADETYIGGKEGNKHASKKLHGGRGTWGKIPVVGVKDRQTGLVTTAVVDRTDRVTLEGFVHGHTEHSATVYTDEASVYDRLHRVHESVKHGVGEYVREQAHTNGIESHWAMLKRGLSPLQRQTSPPLRWRIRGTAQQPATGHGGTDGGVGPWWRGDETPVRGFDRAEGNPVNPRNMTVTKNVTMMAESVLWVGEVLLVGEQVLAETVRVL